MKRQVKINNKLQDWLAVENRTTSLMKHTSVSATPEQRAEKYNERLAKYFLVRKIPYSYFQSNPIFLCL